MESISVIFYFKQQWFFFYPDPFLIFQVVCSVCLGSECWSLPLVNSCMSLMCTSVLAIEHGHWTDSQYPALLVSWFSDDCSVFPLWNKLLALFHFQWIVCLQHRQIVKAGVCLSWREQGLCVLQCPRFLLTCMSVTQESWQMGSIENTYLSILSILAC